MVRISGTESPCLVLVLAALACSLVYQYITSCLSSMIPCNSREIVCLSVYRSIDVYDKIGIGAKQSDNKRS